MDNMTKYWMDRTVNLESQLKESKEELKKVLDREKSVLDSLEKAINALKDSYHENAGLQEVISKLIAEVKSSPESVLNPQYHGMMLDARILALSEEVGKLKAENKSLKDSNEKLEKSYQKASLTVIKLQNDQKIREYNEKTRMIVKNLGISARALD